MEDYQGWIGRTLEREEGLHAEVFARFAALMDDAYAMPGPGRALPPLWHWILFPEVARRSDQGRDGHAARGEFLPPIPLPRRMWAGGRLRMERPLRVGDHITRKSTILDIREKTGRSGRLAFVTVEHEFRVGGAHCLTEEHDIVYREASGKDAALSVGDLPPEEAEWSMAITPDPVMLFQYSALTYNGHRIHYDVDYCRDVEGYPGLVVHGPLTATLMAELVRRHLPEAAITQFSFRALRPLFDRSPFTVTGLRDGDRAMLWATGPDGYVAMQAEAVLSVPKPQ